MSFFARLIVGLLIVAGVAAAARKPAVEAWKKRNRVEFRTDKVSKGDVVGFVTATGKIKPVESILIGSVVSGPITEMPDNIDFNAPIKKGELMARVDPRLYEPQVLAAKATVRIRKAEVLRSEAQLKQSVNAENRAIALRKRREDFVSDAEMDQLRFGREQLEASLEIAKASVEQSQANLTNAEINYDLTFITAPKDGIIIDRKIEPGQTLASSFQTPELFEIGVGMRERMHIYASVDENDIGRIRKAQEADQPVTFTVNAYPDELFHGKILQLRMSATETQAVVTYPVVVEASNPDLKLLPGMTANLSFQIEEKKDVLRVPNQALRFYPKKEHVRAEDQKILDGSGWSKKEEDEEETVEVSAATRTKTRESRNVRHVWVRDGDKLKAIEIRTGIIDQKDGKVMEIVSGELKEGQELVVGVETKKKGMFGR